jgi:RNA polymerase sigma-70 factor (ECF subfamily)
MSSSDDSPSALGSLLVKHKAGDRDAANQIIVHCQERFRLLAHASLSRFTKVPDEVETGDILNELVVRLINTLRQKTFDTPAQFLRYASMTIRSRLIDLAKKCRPIPAGGPGSDTSTPHLMAAIPDSTNEPGKLAQWDEIHTLIDQLPEEERTLFDFLYYQDLTQSEASELLGIPLTTLRTRWLNARVNFMRRLGNDSPF